MHVLVLVGRDVAHGAIARLRPALAQVARDRRDDRPLHGRIAVYLGAGDDVLRVPVMALVVDELAGIAQNRGGGQPVLILRRQSDAAPSIRDRAEAHARAPALPAGDRPRSVCAVTTTLSQRSCSNSRWPRARVSCFGQHLRQDSVAQSKRRVAKTGAARMLSSSSA